MAHRLRERIRSGDDRMGRIHHHHHKVAKPMTNDDLRGSRGQTDISKTLIPFVDIFDSYDSIM